MTGLIYSVCYHFSLVCYFDKGVSLRLYFYTIFPLSDNIFCKFLDKSTKDKGYIIYFMLVFLVLLLGSASLSRQRRNANNRVGGSFLFPFTTTRSYCCWLEYLEIFFSAFILWFLGSVPKVRCILLFYDFPSFC